MTRMSFADVQFLDRTQPLSIRYRKLPHWGQAGTACFVTFRTQDSMPNTILQEWLAARNAWLQAHGLNPESRDWRQKLEKLAGPEIAEFHRLLSDRWHDYLDDCHGECPLQVPERAATVAKSLKHFQGERYLLTDFVVMPNHVHLLAAFPTEDAMLEQCDSWKHFTARELNKALGRSGRFWQQDGFDHLVRSEAQFVWLRRYIAANPEKAQLRPGTYLHESLMPS